MYDYIMSLDENTRWKLILLSTMFIGCIASFIMALVGSKDFRKEVFRICIRPHEVLMGAIHLAFIGYRRDMARREFSRRLKERRARNA